MNSKTRYGLLLIILLFFVGIPLTGAMAITNHSFLILYSNDVQGEIESCG